MEKLDIIATRPFEDSMPLIDDPAKLRDRANNDGLLFFRRLLRDDLVLAMRNAVLDYAARAAWLDPGARVEEGRALPGKGVGFHEDPEWVNLQVHVQNGPEMWALGEAEAIHRVLNRVENRSSYLCLSTANTCRVVSPHPEMVTKPHQDAHYLRTMGSFWTVWIPLGDCPRVLGPIALLAGSHHGGLLDHTGVGIVDGGVAMPEDTVWSTTDFLCGDAVFFRSHTLHRSLLNQSGDRLRLSADFRYGFWDEPTAADWRADSFE